MTNLEAQCQEILNEELTRFLKQHASLLSNLPPALLGKVDTLKSQAKIVNLKITFGEAADLAFVLQHGTHEFPSLQMVSVLDRVVGNRVTDLIEGS